MRQISVEIISYTHDLTDLRIWFQSDSGIKEAGWVLEQHVIVSGMYDQIFLARELTPDWPYFLHRLTIYVRERFGFEHLTEYQIEQVELIDQ